MTTKVSKQLVSIIESIIGELKKKKSTKRVAKKETPAGMLGISNPLAMKRQTNSTRIRELKDRIRIQKLEKELQKRDFAESNQQAREALRNFLNSRDIYEDDAEYEGPIIEEIDEDIPPYRMPPVRQMQAQRIPTPGFSISDAFGAFGQSPGSDRFLTQRAPFQMPSSSSPPLELSSPSEVFESEIEQQQQQQRQQQQIPAYVDYPSEVWGGGGRDEDVPDFGIDPYAQADAGMPYFDARSEEPAAAAAPAEIELPQVIGGRPSVTRASRIAELRSKYRDLAGLELNPAIYRSTKIKELEPPIRDMLLRNYRSLGGANPKVLSSKKIGLIESEIKNLKDALNV